METDNNPYAPPPVNPPRAGMPPSSTGLGGLGSLAQAARDKQIGQARWILILVGILTMAVNVFMLFNLHNEVDQAVRENNVAPAELDGFRQAVTVFGYLIYGGAAALGAGFIVLGLLVKKFPVPITITGLVLYILATLGFAALNPASLVSGIIIKIFIVAGLIRAIKAAFAYEGDMKKAAATSGAYLE